MSTFYTTGCVSDKDNAIDYFEERFFKIQNLIHADNSFQEAIEKLTTENLEEVKIDHESFENLLNNTRKELDTLSLAVNQVIMAELMILENDYQLDRSYKNLVNTYHSVVKTEYSNMIETISNETPNQDEAFLTAYQTSASKLDAALDLFYEAVDRFCEANDIEIEQN